MVLPDEEGSRSRHLSFIEGFTVKRTEQVVLNVEFVRREADAAAHRISCHGDVERVKELKRDIARMVLQHEVIHLLAVVIFGGGWQTPRDEPWFSESGEAMVTRLYIVKSPSLFFAVSAAAERCELVFDFFRLVCSQQGWRGLDLLHRMLTGQMDWDPSQLQWPQEAAYTSVSLHETTAALCPAPGLAAL